MYSCIPPSFKKTLHVSGLSSVRFHNAESVNLSVKSFTFSDSLFRIIDNSLVMYLGSDPKRDVSLVEIFAAGGKKKDQ